jgi:hypothetical protein
MTDEQTPQEGFRYTDLSGDELARVMQQANVRFITELADNIDKQEGLLLHLFLELVRNFEMHELEDTLDLAKRMRDEEREQQ